MAVTGPATLPRLDGSADDEGSLLSPDDVRQRYLASGYDLGQHAAHIIRRAHQRATACFHEVMGGDALTPTQFAALAVILREGELSQIQLGRLTAMDPSTISLVMRKLLKLGLIERSVSTRDQRLTMVRLTAKGQHYTLPRLAQNLEVARRTLAPLSPLEQKTLLRLLERVSGAGEANDAPTS